MNIELFFGGKEEEEFVKWSKKYISGDSWVMRWSDLWAGAGGWRRMVGGEDAGKYKITWLEFVWKIQRIQFWKLDGNLYKTSIQDKISLFWKITLDNLLDVIYRSACWSRAWEKIVLVLFAFNQETNQVPDENFVFKLFLRRLPVCCCKSWNSISRNVS